MVSRKYLEVVISLFRTGPKLPSYYFESTPDFSEDFLRQIADGTFVGKIGFIQNIQDAKI